MSATACNILHGPGGRAVRQQQPKACACAGQQLTTASTSSALTWKMGQLSALATSVQ
jgi:hypothetical protein